MSVEKQVRISMEDKEHSEWLNLAEKNKMPLNRFLKSQLDIRDVEYKLKITEQGYQNIPLLINSVQWNEIIDASKKKNKNINKYILDLIYDDINKKPKISLYKKLPKISFSPKSIFDTIRNFHKSIKSGYKLFCDYFSIATNYHIELGYTLTPFSSKKYLNKNNQVIYMYYIFGIRIARIVTNYPAYKQYRQYE